MDAMEPPTSDLDAFEELATRRRSSLVCDRDREVPGPLLERVCNLVFAAPNHKRTTPWQVAVFTGAERATLGELLAADLVAESPGVAAQKLDKTRTKYGRAPAIVVAGCRPDPDDALRHREDLFAVAAGVENLLLGVASAGLTALWSSPPVLVPSRLNDHAGFVPGTELVALVYIGWPPAPPPPAPRADPAIHWFPTPRPT